MKSKTRFSHTFAGIVIVLFFFMIPQLSYCQVKIGDSYGGGIVFYVDSTGTHGLVCQTKDSGKVNWYDAVKSCKDLDDGWYLPKEDELNLMYTNLHKNGLGGFASVGYWSSTESGSFTWSQEFRSGFQYSDNRNGILRVRAVRAF